MRLKLTVRYRLRGEWLPAGTLIEIHGDDEIGRLLVADGIAVPAVDADEHAKERR